MRNAIRRAEESGSPTIDWPSHLRVKDVKGSPNVLEMTWSFAGPDGRATFQIESRNGEDYFVWRRIGDHRVFNDP